MLKNKAANQKDWGLEVKKIFTLILFLPLNAPHVIGKAISFSQIIICSILEKNLRKKD